MSETRNVNGYISPALTADAILLKGREVLLIRRKNAPFQGAWALPGGFVDVGETVEDAARRELLEETGLRGDIVDLLNVYSDPKRDPRGHTVTVAFVLKVGGIVDIGRPAGQADVETTRQSSQRVGMDIAAGDDAAEARWFPVDALPELAFDHADIVRDARRWLDVPGHFERLGDTDFGKCA